MALTPEETRELKREYGPSALFTQVGDILIVHLDQPGSSAIRARIAEVQREARIPDNCPLCEMERQRGGYTLVYYGNSTPAES